MADGLLNKASIILTPTGYKAGTLYNVAPVVEPYEDFDFARASVASRVNSSGLVEMVGRTLGSELVTNGDFSNGTTEWSSGNSTLSVVDGKLKVLATGAFSYARQNITVVSGKVYKITANFFYNSLVGNIEAYDGTTNIISEQLSEDGVITLYVTPSSTSLRLTLLNRNGSSGDFNYWDNVSVKEIIDTNNIPRISYDSNGENGHILLEPTSKNLVPYSEDFDNWSKIEVITEKNYTSPDGTSNAVKITDNSADSTHRVTLLTTTASSGDFTYSVFLKKGTMTDAVLNVFSNGTKAVATVDLENVTITASGGGVNAKIEDYGNDWYRCSIGGTLASTSTTVYLYLSDSKNAYVGNGDFLYMYGAQLEELSYATSYIPTLTGSTETRATETATGAGSADLINSTEGVLYAEIAALADDGTDRKISLNDGTNDNQIVVGFSRFSGNINAEIFYNGNLQSSGWGATSVTQNNLNKFALSWQNGNYKFFYNGVKTVDQSISNTPSGLNQVKFSYGNNNQPMFCECKALAVFNEALSDDELHNLTG